MDQDMPHVARGGTYRRPWWTYEAFHTHRSVVGQLFDPQPENSHVLNPSRLENKFYELESHCLGEHNRDRHIRDIYSTINEFTKLRSTFLKRIAFVLYISQVVLNVGSIFFAFITRDQNLTDQKYKLPQMVVVTVEFIAIAGLLCRCLYYLLGLLHVLLQECWCDWHEPGSGRIYRLQVASRVRQLYRMSQYLQFSLLSALPAINPANFLEMVRQINAWVIDKYVNVGTCGQCGCVYQTRVYLLAAAKLLGQMCLSLLAVLAVFLKLLQLSFIGSVVPSEWNFAQVLNFVQFINNMISLDQSYRSKMSGKLEFIFCGKDAASSVHERRAQCFFEQLTLVLLREEKRSLLDAMVVYHGMGSEDVNLIFIQDLLEEDKPVTLHDAKQKYQEQRGSSKHGRMTPTPSKLALLFHSGGSKDTPPRRPCSDQAHGVGSNGSLKAGSGQAASCSGIGSSGANFGELYGDPSGHGLMRWGTAPADGRYPAAAPLAMDIFTMPLPPHASTAGAGQSVFGPLATAQFAHGPTVPPDAIVGPYNPMAHPQPRVGTFSHGGYFKRATSVSGVSDRTAGSGGAPAPPSGWRQSLPGGPPNPSAATLPLRQRRAAQRHSPTSSRMPLQPEGASHSDAAAAPALVPPAPAAMNPLYVEPGERDGRRPQPQSGPAAPNGRRPLYGFNGHLLAAEQLKSKYEQSLFGMLEDVHRD